MNRDRSLDLRPCRADQNSDRVDSKSDRTDQTAGHGREECQISEIWEILGRGGGGGRKGREEGEAEEEAGGGRRLREVDQVLVRAT